jgi:hypothetical protein
VRTSFLLRAFLALALILSTSLMHNASAQQSEITALNQQAIRLFQAGRKTEAIGLAEKTVEMARASLGPDNKVSAILLSQLGNFYGDVGELNASDRRGQTGVVQSRHRLFAVFDPAPAG